MLDSDKSILFGSSDGRSYSQIYWGQKWICLTNLYRRKLAFFPTESPEFSNLLSVLKNVLKSVIKNNFQELDKSCEISSFNHYKIKAEFSIESDLLTLCYIDCEKKVRVTITRCHTIDDLME